MNRLENIWSVLKKAGKKFIAYISPIFKFIETHQLPIAISVCIFGTVAFFCSFHTDECNWLFTLLKAAATTLGMFFGNLELPDEFKFSDSFLWGVFVLILYFLALSTTIMVLFRFIGFRLRSWISLFLYSRKTAPKTLNIFWGINDASYILANDIANNRADEKIIFVNATYIDERSEHNSMGVGRLFDLMSMQKRDLTHLKSLNALVTNCHSDLAQIKFSSQNSTSIFDELHLPSLKKIIAAAIKNKENKEKIEIRIFLLSENENNNILGALNLLKDNMLYCSPTTTIYIHASKNSKNDIFDHYSMYDPGMKAKLKVIDSSYLSVAQLKRRSQYHPIETMTIDTENAAIQGAFNSLIVGFGETGQEAFKFMYEFAAFVDSKGNKIPFHCCAIDENMTRIAGTIHTRMPEIGGDELELDEDSIGSKSFWRRIETALPTINYLFVTINDDSAAMSLVVEIYKRALALRDKNSQKCVIFARSHSVENYYQMVELAIRLKKTSINENIEIIIFGDMERMYTCEMIIDDDIIKRAKEFYYAYTTNEKKEDNTADNKNQEKKKKKKNEEQSNADIGEDKNKCDKTADELWAEKYSNIKNGITIETINKLNFEIEQNISNGLHAATKLKLLGISNEGTAINAYDKAIKERKAMLNEIFTDDNKDEKKRKLLNVARCEHERWIAACRIMGYKQGKEKNHINKTHPCILSWEKMYVDEKGMRNKLRYDFYVVEVTINMKKENNKKASQASQDN